MKKICNYNGCPLEDLWFWVTTILGSIVFGIAILMIALAIAIAIVSLI